jgi:predicted HD phosphohydrolase
LVSNSILYRYHEEKCERVFAAVQSETTREEMRAALVAARHAANHELTKNLAYDMVRAVQLKCS